MAIIEDDKSAPGTVKLIDTSGELNVKKSDAEHDVVLVPTPSDDPEDPLNWTKKRKLLATSCVVMYCLMMVFPSCAVYSVETPIAAATSLTIDDLNSGTGAMFLFYGWGCVISQALALQYGKRPMYLFSLAASTAVLIWAPYCTTSGPYLANKILQGLFGSPVEVLCETSMVDLWFAHERPFYMATYAMTLAGGGSIAPAFAAFINSGQDWRWTLWWCAIGTGIAFVYCFFLMEETNYDRQLPSISNASSRSNIELNTEDVILQHFPKTQGESEKIIVPDTAVLEAPAGQVIYLRKTYRQKLSLIDKKRPNRVLDIMAAPFKFFTMPVVVWAGFMYGGNALVWSGVVNATSSTLYTDVYNFTGNDIGYAYFAGTVGMIVGSFWIVCGGPRLVMQLARKNNGVTEPEHILWLFLAAFICAPIAMLLWGLGAAYHAHWFALVFAQGLLGVAGCICVSTAIHYATSSYRDLAGELITTIILIRNTLSFALNYGITPWVTAEGTRNTMITVAAIAFVWNGSMFVMIKYGRRLRENSAKRYWTWVEQAKAKGLYAAH